MSSTRRDWLRSVAAVASAAVVPALEASEPQATALPIIDTHQHLWELPRQRLAWLGSAPEVLRRSYGPAEYRSATEGLNVVRAVYMEVDVDPAQHDEEAASIVALCRSRTSPTCAAVVGGRPASDTFAAYVKTLQKSPEIKGVRQVLHGATTPPGACLRPEFVRGVRLLGEAGLRFDLCPRPAELPDAEALVAQCPGTRFILDHCGNADPAAFRPRTGAGTGTGQPSHDPEAWRRAIAKLARHENVVCKISGIVARARTEAPPDELAPIVNHCLDSFGPDRVMFGGDWPVCLLGRSYRGWVEALRAIVADRPLVDQRKLWHDNARAFYQLAL